MTKLDRLPTTIPVARYGHDYSWLDRMDMLDGEVGALFRGGEGVANERCLGCRWHALPSL